MKPYLDSYQQKTALVAGGAGAIGSNLVARLAALGARVIVLDDLSSAERWNVPSLPNVLFVEGDVLDEVKLKRVFFERPQIVFHLAAFFANQNSVDHPERDLMVNGMGTLRMMEYSVLTGVDRFVYASSGCSIYGSEAPLPLKEEFMSMHLTTPYQITKMLGELYGNFFHHHYGLKVVKTRFFNSYGPGEVPGQYRNVIPNFIYWAMKGQPLPITGSGEETRDFTFVGDIADGLLRSGQYESAIGEEFNLASGTETRIIDLARMVNFQLRSGGPGQLLNVSGGQANSMSLAQLTAWCDQRFGPHQPVADCSERPYDVPWLILDSSKALTVTGWKPQISLHQILEEIANHAAANPDWLTWCGL